MDIAALIARSADRLALPGVLSVRPGTLLRDGWPTDVPAIVVTVREARDVAALPSGLDGVAVDVRVASAAKRLRLEDPDEFVRRYGTDPDAGAVPEFPTERAVVRSRDTDIGTRAAPAAGDAGDAGDAATVATAADREPSDTAADAATSTTTAPDASSEATRGDRAASLLPLPALPDRWSALVGGAAVTLTSAGGDVAEATKASRPELPYTTPTGVALTPVDGPMTLQVSVSPDNGWTTLQAFLAGTTRSLTVGMYDFTSAHVLAAVEQATTGRDLHLVLDHPARNATADQTDEQTVAALHTALGAGLDQAWALDRTDPLATAWVFPSAYHIKVAVRDGATTWLSSGNWNTSNQPAIDPVTNPGDAAEARTRDRDWHVVLDHEGLATTFAGFLEHDLAVAAQHNTTSSAATVPDAVTAEVETPPFAQFFAGRTITGQMRVTPLLTPDQGVYVDAVQALIAGAEHTLHMQFQYIKLPTTVDASVQPFVDLVAAVVARQRAGVEVQIILSQWQTAGYLEQLQTAGLDLSGVRIQGNVHNKGIVVDGHTTLVSSQNWSSDGVLRNRDAGVLIENDDVAAYFDAVFAHDWAHLAQQRTSVD